MKITKKESTRLLQLTIENCIDLWLFTELFVKGTQDYKFYTENAKEISRLPMKYEIFGEVKTLLQKYCK